MPKANSPEPAFLPLIRIVPGETRGYFHPTHLHLEPKEAKVSHLPERRKADGGALQAETGVEEGVHVFGFIQYRSEGVPSNQTLSASTSWHRWVGITRHI